MSNVTKKFTKDLCDINTNTNLIDGVCLTACIVSGSCGESTIPKELVTVRGASNSKALKGTKIEWFPKEALKFVNAASTGTKAILSKYGVRYGDMTLVPIDKLEACQAELREAEIKFNDKLQAALADYEDLIEQHKQENPDIVDLIDDFKLAKDAFESRFKFRVLTPLAMKPLFDEDEDALANDIAETLYDEIASMATKVYYKSIFDKERNSLKSRISSKVKSSLKAIYNKMASLAFVDVKIVKLLEDFKAMLMALPKEGYIEGEDRMALSMFTLLLGDAEKLKLHGAGHNQLIQSVDDIENIEEPVICDDSACMFDFSVDDMPAVSPSVISGDVQAEIADLW